MTIIICFLLLIKVLFGVESSPAINVQTLMTSADLASFGRLTPYKTKHVGNVLINPASGAGIKFAQMTLSTFQLNGQLDYRHITFAIPHNNFTYSISYGTNITGGFIETERHSEVIYDIGEFSSGFNVLNLSVGGTFDEKFFFVDHFYYGAGLSVLSQSIGSKMRSPAYGLDIGLIGTSYINKSWINQIDLGASIINAFSTGLPEWKYGDRKSEKNSMKRQIYLGTKVDIFDYKSELQSGLYAGVDGIYEVMVGYEQKWARDFSLRGSLVYDNFSAKKFFYNLGTGWVLRRVAGYGKNIFNMSVDYNYTAYPFPRVDDPSHTISISFLGQATDPVPIILYPKRSYSTSKPFAKFKGNSNSLAIVNLYNGPNLIAQKKASKNGKWQFDNIRLNQGYNSFTLKAKTGLKNSSSLSKPIIINYDKTPPDFRTDLNILNNKVEVKITSDEPLKKAYLLFGNEKRKFKKRSNLIYSIIVNLPEALKSGKPFPNRMATYNVVVLDKQGNQAPTRDVSFFVNPLFPIDQTIIYNDSFTVLGYASPYVDQIYINNEPITVDQNYGFSKSVELGYGKQLIEIKVKTKNQREINYYARLICIKRFEDIPKFAKYRRDVEFLATFGYVSGKPDGKFYPEEVMTRRDIAVAIANLKKLEPKPLKFDPFLDLLASDPDAGLLAAAVEDGIVYGFADGTFKPDEEVSKEDAFKTLINSGLIESEDIIVDKTPIKRYEFALFFKNVPRYDQRLLYLMDWEDGYNITDETDN